MTYNLLVTSLCAPEKGEPIRYYYAQYGSERKYTDVAFTVEASTKYFLSTVPVNEILVFGQNCTYDEGDVWKELSIDDGRTISHSDFDTLSAFSQFRYRLSQFKSGGKMEQEAMQNLLPQAEKEQAEQIVRTFFEEHDDDPEHAQFNLFFDRLACDRELFEKLKQTLLDSIPEATEKQNLYMTWLRNYLYMNLKDSQRMKLLEENETTIIRFIPPLTDETGRFPVDTLTELSKTLSMDAEEDIRIYVAMGSDEMMNNLLMLGELDILDMFSGNALDVKKVCTANDAHYRLAGMIEDNSDVFRLGELASATNTFLRYGKAGEIVDFWERSGAKNSQLEKMIYAMRRIDIGLSVCDILELTRGIDTLRTLFTEGFNLSDSDLVSQIFLLMAEGIRRDYGRLVTDGSGFIDLVRWAYSKGFYQACLTLIESRAPQDFVNQGIFYYCNDLKDKAHVLELFAEKRRQLQRHEFYKMEDMSHYFIKFYFQFSAKPTTIDIQREKGKAMLSLLQNKDINTITARTECDDLQALEDLMTAYIRIGHIRNQSNHALPYSGESETLSPKESDISKLFTDITECIGYFIQCYDRVYAQVEGKHPTVITVTEDEVKAAQASKENKN